MKKSYLAPQLSVFGSVETLTQALGRSPVDDAVFINNQQLAADTDGSQDLRV